MKGFFVVYENTLPVPHGRGEWPHEHQNIVSGMDHYGSLVGLTRGDSALQKAFHGVSS